MKSLSMNRAWVARKKRKTIHPFDGTEQAVNHNVRIMNMIFSTSHAVLRMLANIIIEFYQTFV